MSPKLARSRTPLQIRPLRVMRASSTKSHITPNTWTWHRQSQEDEDMLSTASLEPLPSSVASPDSHSQKKASHLAMPTSSGYMGGDQLQGSTGPRTRRLTSQNDVSDILATGQLSMGAGPSTYESHNSRFDTTGQIAPPGMKLPVTATVWDDEGSLCFQVEARGIVVARENISNTLLKLLIDNHMINGTKLLSIAGVDWSTGYGADT